MSGITRVRLRDFRRYHDATFTFGPGTTFLEGENNAGKTSVFYAIEYALFGRAGSNLRPTDLLRPGARGVGVELCFTGRDGRHYRLQRVHVRPPRSRSKVVGHFTLWVRDAEPDAPERYLLSSDFDDLETDLALAVQRALGLGRRGWDLAVHLQQGRIPDILDGSAQLDRVLGVSAAVFVEEELRGMALDREKAAKELPALEATREQLAGQVAAKTERADALSAEAATLSERLAETGRRRSALGQALAELEPLQQAADRLDEAMQVGAEAAAGHDRATAARDALGDRATLEAAAGAAAATLEQLDAQRTALRERVSARRADARALEQQKGDLSGRLERARALQGDAVCDHCGQVVDPAHIAAHVPQLEEALAGVTAQLAELSALDEADEAERATQDEAHGEARVASASATDTLERFDEAVVAVAAAADGVRSAAERLAEAVDAARGTGVSAEDDAAALLSALRSAYATERDRLRSDQVRLEADEEHATERLDQVRGDHAEVLDELEGLRRQQAETAARCDQLRHDAALATKLRALGKAFKQVQQDLREQATEVMARRTLALHQHLSGDDRELEDVVVDPKRYVVHVTPRDIGKRVPAGQAQGGGHRLLLGLAARLALAEHIGPVPFVLLDEPTYGLDVPRRQALLGRIAELDVADQLLLITHHEHEAGEGQAVQRVRVVRSGKTSQPEVSP